MYLRLQLLHSYLQKISSRIKDMYLTLFLQINTEILMLTFNILQVSKVYIGSVLPVIITTYCSDASIHQNNYLIIIPNLVK